MGTWRGWGRWRQWCIELGPASPRARALESMLGAIDQCSHRGRSHVILHRSGQVWAVRQPANIATCAAYQWRRGFGPVSRRLGPPTTIEAGERRCCNARATCHLNLRPSPCQEAGGCACCGVWLIHYPSLCRSDNVRLLGTWGWASCRAETAAAIDHNVARACDMIRILCIGVPRPWLELC
jgi:hypothetical protein